MEKKEYSLLDKIDELIKKHFGADFLSDLQRDVIANKIAAANSQSCVTVVSCQDINVNDDNQKIPEDDYQLKCDSVSVVGDILVPDLSKIGKLKMKNIREVVSVKDVSYIDREAKMVVDTGVDTLCITQDTSVQGYLDDETQVECLLDDRSKKEVKRWTLTEIGDRFEGRRPIDDVVLRWETFEGGGNLSKLPTEIN